MQVAIAPGGAHRPSVPCQTTGLRQTAAWLALRLLGTLHRLAYRASGGRLGRTVRGGPVLLLTTIGRRSGRERTWPLCYVPDGDDLVVVASAGGARQHAGWYLNLQTSRRVSVQVGSHVRSMLARTAEGSERARLWERVVERYPVCSDYQRLAGRLIPVVVLEAIVEDLDSPFRGRGTFEARCERSRTMEIDASSMMVANLQG